MRRIAIFILFAFALPFIENITEARILPLFNSRSLLSEKRDNCKVLKFRFDELTRTGFNIINIVLESLFCNNKQQMSKNRYTKENPHLEE